MEEKKSFGKYITRKRKECGLTQRQLADSLYVTESAVSKWERGLSYPDISLVEPICEQLAITEHELITASDDYQHIILQKQAKGYQRVIAAYSWVFYIAYGVALITCLLCNIIIQHTVSWFFIVLASIMLAFSLTNVPIIADRNKAFWTLIYSYASLNILLLTCCIYTGGTWFLTAFAGVLTGFVMIFLPFVLRLEALQPFVENKKALICCVADTIALYLLLLIACLYYSDTSTFINYALPIASFCLLLPWSFLLVIKYTKLNSFYKTSICLFISAAFILFVNSTIDMMINKKSFEFIRFDLTYWSDTLEDGAILNGNITLIIVIILAALGVLFAAGGIIGDLKGRDRE